jgi:mono/diheme cytochrome c family protein
MQLRRAGLAAAACALGWSAVAADLSGPMSSTFPAASAPATTPAAPADRFDVNRLFASTRGWCHSSGGRVAGRGPKLMGTALTDAEITARIKSGKTGAMPSFAAAFNDDQIRAIIRYIRALKPEGAEP